MSSSTFVHTKIYSIVDSLFSQCHSSQFPLLRGVQSTSVVLFPRRKIKYGRIYASNVHNVAGKEKEWNQNLIGLHSQVWVGGWSDSERRKAIHKTAELGYDLLEVSVVDPSVIDVERTYDLLQQSGLESATSLGLSFENDISSEDNVISNNGKQLLLHALEVSSGIGASYLTGVTYSALGKYSKPFPGGQAKKNLVQALREVADQAADRGVILGLEIVNRYESNVLNTAIQGMELLADLDRSNVVIHLDSYHMHIEEASLARAVEICGKKLGYVHIGESHRGYLGTGNLNWHELFRSLANAGYSGPITFESFSSNIVSESLSNTLCIWRNVWDDSEDLAYEAKRFIDSHWNAALRSNTTFHQAKKRTHHLRC